MEDVPLNTYDYRHSTNMEYFEDVSDDKEIGIKITNLKKVFGSKIAVDNMNFKIFANELTVLLGHNGAGKTTTMSMITGFISPTQGEIIVNGYNIKQSLQKVRKQFGLCPQYDVLFAKLTVKEHFLFYGKLKGLSKERCLREMNEYVTALEIHHKINSLSSDLSGGMKRKLSLAMALLGDSKVVILDEPTSGMDPSARRVTWDFLLKQKENRTILLTTHYMDEADVLGDRIAIMADGNLECCGSSLFLKNKYGAGYNLIIVKKESADVKRIKAAISKHVPSVKLENNYAAEVAFVLPTKESGKFPKLFTDLESVKSDLGIESYGVTQATIEEVFLKVGKLHNEKDDGMPIDLSGKYRTSSTVKFQRQRSSQSVVAEEFLEDGDVELSRLVSKNSGITLFIQQFRAMIYKKFIISKRSWFVTAGQFIVPAFFTMLAMLLNIVITDLISHNNEGLSMYLSSYDKVHILIKHNSSNNLSVDLKNSFIETANIFPSTKYLHILDVQNKSIDSIIEGLVGKQIVNYPKYILGVDFENVSYPTIYFNNQGYHTLPLVTNLVTNTVLRLYQNTYINSTNEPLPSLDVSDSDSDSSQLNSLTGMMTGIFLTFASGFVVTTFVISIVKEKSNGAKHQQFVSGINYFVYWLVNILYDFTFYMISMIVPIILIVAFRIESYEGVRLLALFIILVLNCPSIQQFNYFLTFGFKSSAKAFTTAYILLNLLGFAPMIFVAVEILAKSSINLDLIIWIFSIFPYFGFPMAILDLNDNYTSHKNCKSNKLTSEQCKYYFKGSYAESYFSWDRPGILRYIVVMVAQSIFWLLVIVFIESGMWHKLLHFRQKKFKTSENQEQKLDSDVLNEKSRIESTEARASTDILRIESMSKVYRATGGKSVHAVRGLNVGVPRGECFGLLGVNGAGKTTTFKMLTGDISMTTGDAYINSFSVNNNLKLAHREMGYCPQFDALIEVMTGRETLKMYAGIRGIVKNEIEATINELMRSLNFGKYENIKVKHYSGGNRRKLSTAIAMIGKPPLIFFDEPSAG